MLNQPKIEVELKKLIPELSQFQTDYQRERELLGQAMTDFSREDFGTVAARLGEEWHGACPTAEWRDHPTLRIPFQADWRDHETARHWAYDKIVNVPTFAVDGSQIRPSPDFSFSVALVQIGWFENQHTPDGCYEKDTIIRLLTPQDLTIDGEISSQKVDIIRTQMEMARLTEYLTARQDREPRPVVFYDGPLILSFAERLKETKQIYIEELTGLLNQSLATHIPVIGYVDSSRARDLVTMLSAWFGLSPGDQLTDGLLLKHHLRLGERTPVMLARRRGILQEYPPPWNGQIGFVYLKMSQDHLPARLEFPLWIYELGLLEYVINIVRAENLIGNGYPYCLETADVTALLSSQDRDFFYRIFQAFMEKNGGGLTISRKALSKKRRR